MAVETSKHFTLNDATNYVSHVTNTHMHYSIKVSKKRSIVSLQTLWLTYLPRARGQQGSLAYLVFTQLSCYCCFSSRTGLLTLLNAAKTKHLYGKV